MSPFKRLIASAACLLLPAVSLRDASAQTKAQSSAQVSELFAQAQAAFAKGDKNGAYDAYKAAWALQRSYDIAGNLGNLELKLGKHRDAAEHLQFALDDFPPTGDPAQRKAVEKKLADALKEVGQLRVRINVDGASVIVNGTQAGVSPLARPLYLDAGTAVVEAKLAGYVGARESIVIGKSAAQNVSLTLVPERRGPNLALVIGGSAVGVAGIASGIALLVVAGGKASDANKLAADGKAAGLICTSPPQPGACQELHDKNAASDALHNAGVPVLVIGAAFAAATLTYGLWPRSTAERSSKVEVMPLAGRGCGGLLLNGRF